MLAQQAATEQASNALNKPSNNALNNPNIYRTKKMVGAIANAKDRWEHKLFFKNYNNHSK